MKEQPLIGESAPFLAVLDKVSKLAPIERPVLILGERGTGKELIAQRLHYLSKRWDQPLVSLNCSALSEGLIDSELFGHESGSFTGSKGKHQGRFERAENGTLFLDELATAPLSVQEKLLRVIEYGEYERVGGNRTLQSNVRLICATNADIQKQVSQEKFRPDLLDRLAFDVIHIPPLRARKEDIPLLAEHYAIKMCRELKLPLFTGFNDNAYSQLMDYQWPGNVRELKNVIERAVYQNGNSELPIQELVLNPFVSQWQPSTDAHTQNTLEHDSAELSVNEFDFPLNYKQWQENLDIELLNAVLEKAKHNQKVAAELLGLSYHQLRGMLRKYNLVGPSAENSNE
ncbi:phage shock protein operon transcriptional activator [Vibrio hannami]|uniref:phage shock protein operon transcriptional activator n=1 Tax=Vibrio hannami TaxID=2717094 RepID=UPI00240EAE53|nr:phage shock protein operon transcriptional activator [Vibrio hannami]MDG3088351.1 phage shock protein operon transcriptional activator [Vibrio hannami]